MNMEIQTLRAVIVKVTQLLAGQTIQVTQQGMQAFVQADPKTGRIMRVNIPQIPDNASPELVMAVQGFIDHEVGHILDTDPVIMRKANEAGERTRGMWNVVEDTYIERTMAKRFPGTGYNLDRLHEFFLREVTVPALRNAKTPRERFSYLLVPAARAWAGQRRFQEFMKDYWDHPDYKPQFDKLGELPKKFQNVKSSAEALALAQEILRAFDEADVKSEGDGDDDGESRTKSKSKSKGTKSAKSSKGGEKDPDGKATKAGPKSEEDEDEKSAGADESPDESEKGEDEKDDASKDSPDKDSDGDQDEDGSDAASADGDKEDDEDEGDGEGEGSEDADDEGDDEGGSSDGDDDADEDDDDSGKAPKSEGKKKDQLESDEKSKSFEPISCADFDNSLSEVLSEKAAAVARTCDYLVYTKDFDRVETFDPKLVNPAYSAWRGTPAFNDNWLTELDEQTRHMVGLMQKDIERMMAARSKTINLPGQRRGRLNASGLHRLATNDDRVFRTREEHRSKDVAVGLLIDNSGSMGGVKMQVAMTSGYALSQTLERVGIKHEVLGFTTLWINYGVSLAVIKAEERRIGRKFSRYEPLNIPVFKGFSERLTTEVRKRFAYSTHTHHLANNVDGECVEVAAHRLMLRPEKRKVLLVLSDGQPAAETDRHHDLQSHLKQTVDQVTKKGVECIGIGIMSEAVRSYYPKYMVLKNVDELPTTVMGELKRILTAS